MGTVLRMIAFSVVKNYILPRIIDEVIKILKDWAARTEFTDVDDAAVAGLEAHKEELVAALKKTF